MKFDNEQRTKLIDYFHVYEGNENSASGVKLETPLHPSTRRAYEILEPFFVELIESQELTTNENLPKLLRTVDNVDLKNEIIDKVKKHSNRIDYGRLWELIKNVIENHNSKKKAPNNKKFKYYQYQIVLSHLYPRLDVNVSKQINHLLKAPFCVHPKTSNELRKYHFLNLLLDRVCVPMDPATCEDFSPEDVPVIHSPISTF
jgi:DNA primase small subunit